MAPAPPLFYNHFSDLDSRPPLAITAATVTLALDSRTTPTSPTYTTSSITPSTPVMSTHSTSSPSLPRASYREVSSSTRVVERVEVEGSRKMRRGKRRAAVILDLPPHLSSPVPQVDGLTPALSPVPFPDPTPAPSPRTIPSPGPSPIPSPRPSPFPSPHLTPGPSPLPTFGPELPHPPGPWAAHPDTTDPAITCTLPSPLPHPPTCPYCTYTVRNPGC